MIDVSLTNAITNMEERSADALGYSTPGYQPKFHEAMSDKPRSIGVPDPLSVAAPKDTFFVVENQDGSRSYIRAGNFQVRDGKLLSNDGRQVLGYPNGRIQGGLVPLTMPEGTPSGWVNIAADGTVSIADPKTQPDRYSGSGVGLDENRPGEVRLPSDHGSEMQKRATVNWDQEIHGASRNEYGALIADPRIIDAPQVAQRSSTAFEAGHGGPINVFNDPNDETGLALRAATHGGAAGIGVGGSLGVANDAAGMGANGMGSVGANVGLGAETGARTGVNSGRGIVEGGIGAEAPRNDRGTALNNDIPSAETMAEANLRGAASDRSIAAQTLGAATGDDPAMLGAADARRSGSPDRAAADRTVDDAAGDRAADTTARMNAGTGVGFSPVGAGATAGSSAPAVGTPIGKIALARFAAGTTVTRDGSPTARVPVELGTPKTGQIGSLKTNARDLGSVDQIRANTAILEASHLLSAVMAAEQSRQSRAKKAMDLIK